MFIYDNSMEIKHVNSGLSFLSEWAAKDKKRRILRGCEIVVNGRLIDIDAIIMHGSTPIAVVAIANPNNLDSKKRFIGEILRVSKYPVGIVCSDDKKLWTRILGAERFSENTSAQIIDILEQNIIYYQTPVSESDVRKKLISIFDSSKDFKNKDSLRTVFVDACNSLVIRGGRISFQEQDENLVMHSLLGSTKNISKICRYTPFGSLFKMLDNKNITMCCVRSMNDPKEGRYSDSFIVPSTKYIPRSKSDIDMENLCFLLSCSPKRMSDDLTMFRLYGDNAKGVCQEFIVDHDKIDDKQFFFAPVSYGNSENEHPELELLSALQNTAIIKGWYFILNRWYVWRYFFKSYAYSVEKEIRLIFFPDTAKDDNLSYVWYTDDNNGILNRLVSFPMESEADTSFPFLLSSVILGPNCPEQRINVEQVQYMVDVNKYKTAQPFSVVGSTHTNYR